jgi:hypothetical protein
MKNLISVALLYILILLFHSCEYEPAGVYNLITDHNATPPHLQIVNLNINRDTIILYSQSTIKFTFNTEYQNVRAVTLLIDSTEIGIVHSNSGEFQLLAGSINQGIYEMVLKVYTGTGTGTIADAVGAEGYVFKKSWKLIVRYWSENETKLSIINGLLHLKLPEFDKSNFEEYIICRFDDLYNEIEIGRSVKSEFVDSSYVGEGAQYIVKGKNTDGSIFTLESPRIYPDLPELSFSADTLNQYVVKWRKSKYYGAVGSYSVFLAHEYLIYDLVNSTSDVQDTTYNLNDCVFGDKIFVKLRIVPKNSNVLYVPGRYSAFEKEIYPELGFAFRIKDYLNDLFPVNQNEFIYALGCDSIIRYSLSSMSVVERTSHTTPDYYCCEIGNLATSPSGNYVTAQVGCWDNILFTSSSAIGLYSEINPGTIAGYAGTVPVHVSDIGTGLLNDTDGNILIYDFLNLRILGKQIRNSNYPSYLSGMKLSGNGDYLLLKDDSLRLIHFTDGEFKTITMLSKPDDKAVYEFDAVNNGQFIYWDGLSLKVYRCDTGAMVYEFPLTETLLDIDYNNYEILTYSSGLLNIRSFNDGSLLANVPVNFIPSWGKTCYLINHTIIYTAGLMYFIR